MILLGCFGKIGAVFASIPTPIVGGMLIVTSSTAMSGFIIICYEDYSACNDIECNDISHVTIQIRGPCRSII